jgi:type IV pilus assembly protein PilO
MTVGSDFIPQDADLDVAPEVPTAFGVPVPLLVGILLGVAGLGGAFLIFTKLVGPLKESTDQVNLEVQQRKERLAQKQRIEAQLKQARVDLLKVNEQREQVLSLFATERDLNTLLLDLNQVVERNNAGVLAARQAKLNSCPPEIRQQYASLAQSQEFEDKIKGPLVAEAKLQKFKPDPAGTQVITNVGSDSYLQPPLVNKLKRQTYEVELEGNFAQTQAIFRTLERLQPLLIIKDLSIKRKIADGNSTTSLYTTTPSGAIQFLTNCQPETITTTGFKMDALMPLSPEEAKKLESTPEPSASPAQ